MQMWTCVQLLGFEREIKCDSRTDVAFYLSICLPQHYRFSFFASSSLLSSAFPACPSELDGGRCYESCRHICRPVSLSSCMHACLSASRPYHLSPAVDQPTKTSFCWHWRAPPSCHSPPLHFCSVLFAALAAVYCFHLLCPTNFFSCQDKLVTTALWRQPTRLHVSILILYFTCAAGVRAPLHSTGLLINAASILMEFQGLLCFYINMHCGYRVGSTARELCFCS